MGKVIIETIRIQVPCSENVTSITLEVVNNNFGTGGGNDVLMDDIEIYLVIPPVTLVPSVNGYVCAEDEGVLILKGTYTDDGTLGNYLDYRWEFSPTGKDGAATTCQCYRRGDFRSDHD